MIFTEAADIRWCCSEFRNRYYLAGKRGLAINVYRDAGGHIKFHLQHRCLDEGQNLKVPSDVAVILVAETGLMFCPWCGCNLKRRYEKYVSQLDRPELAIEGTTFSTT